MTAGRSMASLVAAILVSLIRASAGLAVSFPPSIELASLDGTTGFAVLGLVAEDFAGSSLASAGDVNADGIDDLLIGASGANPGGRVQAGEVYVIFGRTSGFPQVLDLTSLDGSNGLVIRGILALDRTGESVAAAGDVNFDGIDDMIFGAPQADPNGKSRAGQAYVVFGRDDGFPASLELSTLDGSNGFAINGPTPDDLVGAAVAGAVDLNADGIDDVVVGAPGIGGAQRGNTYVVYGRPNGFPAAVETGDLAGTNGFKIVGAAVGDFSGTSVASVGDVNDDGIEDIAIAAEGADPGGRRSAGSTFIVYGSGAGFASPFPLASLDGKNGSVVNGIDPSDFSGPVASAGDVNGDGIADLLIGASSSDPDGRELAGESYVVFGRTGGLGSSFELSSLDGMNGFIMNGVNEQDWAGRKVSGAGDVNGDGLDDVLIGAPYADPEEDCENDPPGERCEAGEGYVVLGDTGGFSAAFELADLDGRNGFAMYGVSESHLTGWSVAGVGDLDADGIDEIAISARQVNGLAGVVYIVFGRRSCSVGTVHAGVAPDRTPDVLFVNGSAGSGRSPSVEVQAGAPTWLTLLRPPLGGSGRFVVHANLGPPESGTALPFDVGTSCFPMLLPDATPAAVWNNIGFRPQVGESRYLDGTPIEDPSRAPTVILYLPFGDPQNLPPGTELTLQGILIDPGSASPRGGSVTNSVTLTIVDGG